VGDVPGRPWARALGVCGALVAVDQLTKAAIASALDRGERIDLVLGFDLARVANEGIAFGLLADGRGVVLAVTLGALAALLAWFVLDSHRPGFWLATGLVSGGALGNLADRVRDGSVTDFLDPPLWPAFNLADVAITLGAAGLVLITLAGRGQPASAPP
jgi:signal peptidase II